MRGNVTGWWDNEQLLVLNKTGGTLPRGLPVGISDFGYVMDSSQPHSNLRRLPSVDDIIIGHSEMGDCMYVGVFEDDCPTSVALDRARNIWDLTGVQGVTLKGEVQVMIWNPLQADVIAYPGDCVFFDNYWWPYGAVLAYRNPLYTSPGGYDPTVLSPVEDEFYDVRQIGTVLEQITVPATNWQTATTLVWCYIDRYPRIPDAEAPEEPEGEL